MHNVSAFFNLKSLLKNIMGKYKTKRVSLHSVTLEGEIWKSINGLDSLYLISNKGRIYSNVSNRLIKCKPNKHGYMEMPIGKKDQNRKNRKIHRLVAEAFLPNPFNKKEVNHIDKDRTNNSVENLEWSTAWENTQHKYGKSIWNSDQGRIAVSSHSVARRQLAGFSNMIIPALKRLVPLD
jgi:hypothetical protein